MREFRGFGEEKLDGFLLTKLHDVFTYTFGGIGGFSIYTVGKTLEKDFLGVHTIAVWT